MGEDEIYMGEEVQKGKETKREKFVRLAEYRTNKILDMIRILGNCSNRATNEYNEEDVEQIFGAIEEALQETRARFTAPASKKAPRFFLKNRPASMDLPADEDDDDFD